MNLLARRPLFKPILITFLWIGLIVWFAYFIREFPSAAEWKEIITTDKAPGTFFLSACIVVVMITRGIRWGVILKPHFYFSWRKVIFVFGWCFVLMVIAPFRSGELFRAWWVTRQGGSAAGAAGGIAAERLVDLMVLLSYLGLVAVFATALPAALERFGFLWLVVILFVYVAMSFLAGPLERWMDWRSSSTGPEEGKRFVHRVGACIHNFVKGISVLSQWKVNLLVLVLTIMIWGILAGGFFCYLRTFFPEIHWAAAVAVLALVNLSGLVLVAPGNVGIYEMAVILALKPFGVQPSKAIVAAVGLHATVLLVMFLYGFCCRVKLMKSEQQFWEPV